MVPRRSRLASFLERLFFAPPTRDCPPSHHLRVGLIALTAGLLGACDPATTPESRSPAVTVPHGELDPSSLAIQITPRARAVQLLSERAASAGLQPHTLQGAGGPLALLVEIDLTAFEPVLLSSPTGITPQAAINQVDMVALIGSGFVSLVRKMEPIGLLQHNGTLRQGIEQHGYTRILGITSSPETGTAGVRFDVLHRSEWQPDLFRSALQAGPGIVEGGKLDISERDLQRPKYFRSFVAACGETALIGASLTPTHLHTLGGALVDFFTSRNLPCDEVVNLAGDREAVLVVRNQDDEAAFFGDPEPKKMALVGFRRRPTMHP